MTVKETYHADCLRIKQLENQVEGYKGENGEQFERIEELKQQLAQYEKAGKRLIKELRHAISIEPDIEDNAYKLYEAISHYVEEFESEQNGNDK